VAPAQRRKVALAGAATLVVGDRVVQVAADSGSAAARETAGSLADLHQGAQQARRPVPRGLAAVAARAPFQAGEREAGEPGRVIPGLTRRPRPDRPQAWATARPSEPVSVTHQRAVAPAASLAARSRHVSASKGPSPAISPGLSDASSQADIGIVRFTEPDRPRPTDWSRGAGQLDGDSCTAGWSVSGSLPVSRAI